MTEYERLSLRLLGLIAGGISLLAAGLPASTMSNYVNKVEVHAAEVSLALASVEEALGEGKGANPPSSARS